MIRKISLMLLLAGLIGCGGAKTYPVEGTVIFKETGQPAKELAGYSVSTESEKAGDDGKKYSGSGQITPEGTFKISTFAANDGLMVGKHLVAISPPVPTGDGPPPKALIPVRYGDLGTSGLTITVESGKAQPKLEVSKK